MVSLAPLFLMVGLTPVFLMVSLTPVFLMVSLTPVQLDREFDHVSRGHEEQIVPLLVFIF